MTLKLVSKNLPNKYAEQLFKNELSFSADMDKQNDRIKLDYLRNSQFIDVSSQVFLNRIRQKRSQWKKDDVKYREYYKLICRNSYNKYLETNDKTSADSNRDYFQNSNINNILAIEDTKRRNLLRPQTHSENNIISLVKHENTFVSLPPIKQHSSFEFDLSINPYIKRDKGQKPFAHGKYSPCDKEFLEKLPEKVELTHTDIGKRFIENKREQTKMINRQKKNFAKIQNNALLDNRFKNLVSSLDL
jgi:hypothetical protein